MRGVSDSVDLLEVALERLQAAAVRLNSFPLGKVRQASVALDHPDDAELKEHDKSQRSQIREEKFAHLLHAIISFFEMVDKKKDKKDKKKDKVLM